MTQLVRLQSRATALVVLRFWFGWCQSSYHARTVLPDSLLVYAQKKCRPPSNKVSRRNHQSRRHSGGIGSEHTLPSNKADSASETRSQLPNSLLGLKQQHHFPLHWLLDRLQRHTHTTPAWPLQRHTSAATSERTYPGGRTAGRGPCSRSIRDGMEPLWR